ncbi:MAG TPA: extracellular solute-binding protein, partial [Haloplasmataceae bacterium]
MKKFFSLLLVFALALTLAACRDRKNDQDLYDYDIITELPEGKIVEITVWHSFGEHLESLIQGYIDEFEKEYPNIKVTFKKEGGNYTELRKKVVNNITTGTTPTLVFTYPDHVAAYLDGKAVLALDPFINDPKVGFTQEELDDFIDSYLEENRQFGYYMGLP